MSMKPGKVTTKAAGGKDALTICFRPNPIKESLPKINIQIAGVRGNANK